MKTLHLKLIVLFFGIVFFSSDGFSQSVKPIKPITGGFIQYNSTMIKTSDNPNGLSAEDWKAEVRTMYDAGMDTVIIQFLQLDDESFIPQNDPDAVDPTKAILTAADEINKTVPKERQIKVIIGLWNKEWRGELIRFAVPEMLKKNELNSKSVASLVWEKYSDYNSFYAWYIPQEIWNIAWDPSQNVRMRKSFRTISDYCKGLRRKGTTEPNNKPVAISPYFDPHGYPGDESNPEETYKKFLKGDEIEKGAGINILMLQDGVGANCIKKGEIYKTVEPYFRYFYNATKYADVEMWGNVESFQRTDENCSDDSKNVPTSIERLTEQTEIASIKSLKEGVPILKKLVTFDFFEFMSPIDHKKHFKDKLFKKRKKLYDDYKNAPKVW